MRKSTILPEPAKRSELSRLIANDEALPASSESSPALYTETTCPCGGSLTRHGTTDCKLKAKGYKLRCNQCGKTITVRNGKIASRKEPFRPLDNIWQARA